MNPFQWLRSFGYDATEAKNKRKAPTGLLRGEDAELLPEQRRRLLSSSRDLQRNFSLAAWMVRRHLDYVSTFAFQAKNGNEQLDDLLEAKIKEYSKADNCDVAGRHGLHNMIRLTEARKTIDGDCGLIKLIDGRLQAIEGDRIKTPLGGASGYPEKEFTQGVRCDVAGKALEYAVCRRGDSANAFIFERLVPRSNLYLHGAYERFDQVRGISQLAAAINTLRDTYEGFEYALAKLKVDQLFGLVFYRQSDEPLGHITAEEEDSEPKYQVDFGKGPWSMELDPGDRAEFLESKSPSEEFQSFTQTMISVALKALDIPYSFYAENFTNYSGARQALLQYQQSADIKRADVATMLDDLTAWRIRLWIMDGELPNNIDWQWQWIPRGLPWIDPLKEIQAEIEAIDTGLDNPEDICQRHGRNFYENIDKIQRCRQYAEERGVKLMTRGASKPDEEETKPGQDAKALPIDDREGNQSQGSGVSRRSQGRHLSQRPHSRRQRHHAGRSSGTRRMDRRHDASANR